MIDYEVTYSYTLDHVSWVCPKCLHNNELSSAEVHDLCCGNCGFEREQDPTMDTYDTSETYVAYED